MFTNGQWKPTIALAELAEVVFTTTMALLIQLLLVTTTTLRLTVASSSVSAQLYTCSTDHWFNEPEKINKYDVSANAFNTYFSASKTLKEKIGAHSGVPLLRLRVCKHNKGETYINFCKGVIVMSFSTMLELLQEKNNQRVVLIKTGVIYIATGKDAIF